MIRRPSPGQWVQIHYARELHIRPGVRVTHPARSLWEGASGVVAAAGRGLGGPINVLVQCDDGRLWIGPRGNLLEVG